MEDLWNSITLPTLHTPSSSSAASHHHLRPNLTATILQGFPAGLPSSSHSSENMFVSGSPDSPPSPSPQTSFPSIHSRLGDRSFLLSPPPPPPGSSHDPFDQTSGAQENGMNPACDRRHQRMIKNRESAARSRARKQAYTTELELKIAQLKQENASLRTEQEMRSQAAVDHQRVRRKLRRTSTAPF